MAFRPNVPLHSALPILALLGAQPAAARLDRGGSFLSRTGTPDGSARGRPARADDARGEGGPDDVALPHGHGLSCTTNRHGAPAVAPATMEAGADAGVEVTVDVTNTGGRTGDEVVQLYVGDLLSRATRPVRELRGFERVTLEPGESRTVTFRLRPDDLAHTGIDMERVVEPGEFEVCTGGSSASLQCASPTVH